LTDEDKKFMVASMLKDGKKVEQLVQMQKNGQYLLYVPLSFIHRIFQEYPDDFFEKGVFKRSVSKAQTDLLGEHVVKAFYKRDVKQLKANLEILLSFMETGDFEGMEFTPDVLLLQQVALSIKVIGGMMKEDNV
jgi:uncharacterized protein YbgA (DUF1722 family)